MLKVLTLSILALMCTMQAHGQPTAGKSADELRIMISKSPLDSGRLLLLYELGRIYLKQVYSDNRVKVMDTAISVFDHAIRLSDTLRMKNMRYESMLLKGEGWFERGNEEPGKKLFFEVASIYHAQHDIEREARTWLRLARKINSYAGSSDDCIGYFGKSISLYKEAHNLEREANAHKYFGLFLFLEAQPAAAEKELLHALSLCRAAGENKVALIYMMLSTINRYQAAFDKALLYSTKCLETVYAANDTAYIEQYYGEIALVYDELNRIEESAIWYRQALDKRIQRYGDAVDIYRTAGFLIRQMVKQGKSKGALMLMDTIMSHCAPNSLYAKATIAQNLGYCFDGLKQYAKAEQYFLSMVSTYQQGGITDEFAAIGNMDMARFYLAHQQYRKARSYLDTAIVYEKTNPLSDRRELFQLLFSADSGLGNYQLAVDELLTLRELDDSIFNVRKSEQIAQLTLQFRTAEKEQDIRLLEKEKRIQQAEIQSADLTKKWILGGLALMGVIILLLVNQTGIRKRANKQLTVQQKEIAKQNEALHRLVDEKEWLVREIHHRVKNNLHIVQGLLGTQAGYLKSEEAINALTESRHRIEAMSIMHRKLYQSESLSTVNSKEYIHELVSHLKSSFQTGQSIVFTLAIDPMDLNTSYCIPVGLILNEAVTNAMKYAFPDGRQGQIDISLKHHYPARVELCVRDNGIGMPSGSDLADPQTMGLRLMNGLARDIDGSLTIDGDNGVSITLDFTYDGDKNVS